MKKKLFHLRSDHLGRRKGEQREEEGGKREEGGRAEGGGRESRGKREGGKREGGKREGGKREEGGRLTSSASLAGQMAAFVRMCSVQHVKSAAAHSTMKKHLPSAILWLSKLVVWDRLLLIHLTPNERGVSVPARICLYKYRRVLR